MAARKKKPATGTTKARVRTAAAGKRAAPSTSRAARTKPTARTQHARTRPTTAPTRRTTRTPKRRPARPTRPRTVAARSRRLDDIAETLAIMVPELAARIAALEHVLIEGKVCRHDDLRHARAFVDLRRGDR